MPVTTLPVEPVTRTVRNLQRKADRLQTGEQCYGVLEARIEARLQMLGGNVTLGQFELIDTPEDDPEE